MYKIQGTDGQAQTSPAMSNLFVTSDEFTRWMQCSGPLPGASRKMIYSVLLGWIQASNVDIIVAEKAYVLLAGRVVYCH